MTARQKRQCFSWLVAEAVFVAANSITDRNWRDAGLIDPRESVIRAVHYVFVPAAVSVETTVSDRKKQQERIARAAEQAQADAKQITSSAARPSLSQRKLAQSAMACRPITSFFQKKNAATGQ